MNLFDDRLCLECRPKLQPAFKWKDEGTTFDPTPYLERGAGLEPVHTTALGALFSEDCLKVLPAIRDSSIDTVFADPPFNLGKPYRKGTNDGLQEAEYVRWCKAWIDECVRILKPGGALFLYNLPKWNMIFWCPPTRNGHGFQTLDSHRTKPCASHPQEALSFPLQPSLLHQRPR